jgi:hypothetical protein
MDILLQGWRQHQLVCVLWRMIRQYIPRALKMYVAVPTLFISIYFLDNYLAISFKILSCVYRRLFINAFSSNSKLNYYCFY